MEAQFKVGDKVEKASEVVELLENKDIKRKDNITFGALFFVFFLL